MGSDLLVAEVVAGSVSQKGQACSCSGRVCSYRQQKSHPAGWLSMRPER